MLSEGYGTYSVKKELFQIVPKYKTTSFISDDAGQSRSINEYFLEIPPPFSSSSGDFFLFQNKAMLAFVIKNYFFMEEYEFKT